MANFCQGPLHIIDFMKTHIPRKRFGQVFLQDTFVIAAIVQAVNPHPNDVVIEIGPGLGAITKPLLAVLNYLHVVEIDRDIIRRLEKNFSAHHLKIHACDALEFDFASVADCRLKIVGNLPYNISTPLLFHLASYGHQVLSMHFMLQKEVTDRMVAQPSTSAYGRLTVMLQYRFEIERILHVPPEAFWPLPRVDSAVVRMIPSPGHLGLAVDESLLEQVVRAAFSHRRKTLKNNLNGFLDTKDFSVLALSPGLRPGDLSVEDYVRLANYLSKKGRNGRCPYQGDEKRISLG